MVLASYITNRVTTRNIRRQAEADERVEDRKLDLAAMKQQYDGWKSDALALRQMRDEDSTKFHAALAEQEKRFEEKCLDLHSKVESLEARLRTATQERIKEQAYMESVIAWCRVVVRLLSEAGIAYPPLPPGIYPSEGQPSG